MPHPTNFNPSDFFGALIPIADSVQPARKRVRLDSEGPTPFPTGPIFPASQPTDQLPLNAMQQIQTALSTENSFNTTQIDAVPSIASSSLTFSNESSSATQSHGVSQVQVSCLPVFLETLQGQLQAHSELQQIPIRSLKEVVLAMPDEYEENLVAGFQDQEITDIIAATTAAKKELSSEKFANVLANMLKNRMSSYATAMASAHRGLTFTSSESRALSNASSTLSSSSSEQLPQPNTLSFFYDPDEPATTSSSSSSSSSAPLPKPSALSFFYDPEEPAAASSSSSSSQIHSDSVASGLDLTQNLFAPPSSNLSSTPSNGLFSLSPFPPLGSTTSAPLFTQPNHASGISHVLHLFRSLTGAQGSWPRSSEDMQPNFLSPSPSPLTSIGAPSNPVLNSEDDEKEPSIGNNRTYQNNASAFVTRPWSKRKRAPNLSYYQSFIQTQFLKSNSLLFTDFQWDTLIEKESEVALYSNPLIPWRVREWTVTATKVSANLQNPTTEESPIDLEHLTPVLKVGTFYVIFNGKEYKLVQLKEINQPSRKDPQYTFDSFSEANPHNPSGSITISGMRSHASFRLPLCLPVDVSKIDQVKLELTKNGIPFA